MNRQQYERLHPVASPWDGCVARMIEGAEQGCSAGRAALKEEIFGL